MLQTAESAWTLCNFHESKEGYLQAANSFQASLRELSSNETLSTNSDFQEYSEGWMGLAFGMYHNLLGCILLRDGKVDEGVGEFANARDLLHKSETSFAKINNALGQHDARSYIVDDSVWRSQKMLFSNVTEARWKDYVYFESDSTFERLLASLQLISKYPSELLTRVGAESLKLSTANIGKLTLSRIGDIQPPPLEVRILFHPEYVLEIEYHLKLNARVDPFTLYLLKIFNTDAVPTYDASFETDIPGIAIKMDDCRLRDITHLILEAFVKQVRGDPGMTLLNSFVVLHLYDFSPHTKASGLGLGDFRYMNGIFSETETLTMQTSGKEMPLSQNLFESRQNGEAAAYLTQRSAVLVVSEMQEWEVRLYSEIIDYTVETRETIEKMLLVIQKEANALRARLETLRDAVERNASINQREVRELISRNLDIRLRALRLFDIRQKHSTLKQSGIADVRSFSENVDERLHVADQFRQTESQLERIEALYNTASSLGQDYLSLVIAVNSDISRRAFNVLNVVMMGTLGLAITTAILSTPISYTFAVLAVFATSFFGYVYLAYVRRKVTRLSR